MSITAAAPQHHANALTRAKDWLDAARAKGSADAAALDRLAAILAQPAQLRQRLLYLHTSVPSPAASVVASYLIDPVAGGANLTLDPNFKPPYASVHDAMRDGWSVVHFPDQRAHVQDKEIDVPTYEFVLAKWELFDS